MQVVMVMQLIGVVTDLAQNGDDLTFNLLCPTPTPSEGMQYEGRVAVAAKVASLANDRFMSEGEVVAVHVEIDRRVDSDKYEHVLNGVHICYLTDGTWGVRGFRDTHFPQFRS